MAPDNEKIKQQYEVLHQRTWNYNDLLWKNFIAYGAVLSAVAALYYKDLKDAADERAWILVAGAGVLWFLGIIQINLLRGHRKSVERLAEFESSQGYAAMTTTPTWSSLFGAYAMASMAMVGFACFLLWFGCGKLGSCLGQITTLTVFGSVTVFYLHEMFNRTKKKKSGN